MRPRSITYEELKSLEGRQFGRLTVLSYEYTLPSTNLRTRGYDDFYKCQCSCDNKIILVKRHDLLRHHKLSCGCLQSENAREQLVKAITTHGLSHVDRRFYCIWKLMKARCCNHNNPDYNSYGGRGIGIDWAWFMFDNFYNDMYPSYVEHCNRFGVRETTLDRINVNDIYCKDNCRWATRIEQANNKRGTIRVLYNGSEYTCRELLNNFPHHESVTAQLLLHRIVDSNWDIKRALETPCMRIKE